MTEQRTNGQGQPDVGDARQEVEWPKMDAAAYYGFAGEVVHTISPHSESDPVALLLQLLTCFGNIIGRARYFRVEGNRHHPNLFIKLIGKSSKARKGTSLGRVQSVVDIADHKWTDERIQGGLSSGEGLINVVRDPSFKWDKEEQEWVEVDHGVEDKRLLIVEPEFAGVLAVMARSGNTVSQLIRKGWDGSKLQTMTRRDPLTATNAHISIIGHITADELRATLTRTEMANGFANRFLLALIRRSTKLPFGGNLSDSDILHLGQELQAIITSVLGDPLSGVVPPPQITMTATAAEKWVHVYDTLSDERSGLLGAITARAEAQTLRLAMIYALLDRRDQIDLPHLEGGLAVWNYCDRSAALIFGAALGNETADAILRALTTAGSGGMTRSMINDLFGGHQSRGQISVALELLLEKGCARFVQIPTRGRPIETWYKA